MLDKLISLLESRAEDPRPEMTERLATAALLVTAARADGIYEEGEAARIARVLAARFDLSEVEAITLRAEAETAEDNANDLIRFTQAVKKAVPHEKRVEVIEALWEVIYADGDRSYEEAALVRRLCGLLYVEDRDAGLARQRVEARL